MKHSIRMAMAAVAAFCGAASGMAEPLIQDGQKLAFLGDSITQGGASRPSGYVRLIVSGLEANGIKVTPIPAGISGHKSNDMLGRLDNDVLSKKPDVMTLSCGVNDVWHGARGVPLEQYQQNITAIIDQATAAGVKVVILTSTMILEDQANVNNQKLAAYNEFLRALAAERKLPLADLGADMQAAVLRAKETNAPRTNGGNFLTSDGVHMAPPGDLLMAEGVLRALGLDPDQLAKAKAFWMAIPESVKFNAGASMSLATYQRLQELAAKEDLAFEQYISAHVSKAIEALTKPQE